MLTCARTNRPAAGCGCRGAGGSGHIAAAGARIRRFEVGDKVYACSFNNPKGGFHAQYTHRAGLTSGARPPALDLAHAGAVAVTGLTALAGIETALTVKEGESLLIAGASGGVGTAALPLAKRRGARVLAIASGPDGVALARRLGAVDGHRDDVTTAIEALCP